LVAEKYRRCGKEECLLFLRTVHGHPSRGVEKVRFQYECRAKLEVVVRSRWYRTVGLKSSISFRVECVGFITHHHRVARNLGDWAMIL
jgi:hypothetical protein